MILLTQKTIKLRIEKQMSKVLLKGFKNSIGI